MWQATPIPILATGRNYSYTVSAANSAGSSLFSGVKVGTAPVACIFTNGSCSNPSIRDTCSPSSPLPSSNPEKLLLVIHGLVLASVQGIQTISVRKRNLPPPLRLHMIPLAIPTRRLRYRSDNCGSQCRSNIYFHHFQHRAVTTGTSPNFFFQKSDLTYGTVDLPSSTLSAPDVVRTVFNRFFSFGFFRRERRTNPRLRRQESGSDTGAISESNEVNNCSPWTTVTTTTTPPPYDPTRYPDLVASATAPTTAVANVAQTYTSIISNIGAVTTGTSPNFFFQKSDLTYGTVDLPSSTLSAPMLSGQSLTASSPSVSFGGERRTNPRLRRQEIWIGHGSDF